MRKQTWKKKVWAVILSLAVVLVILPVDMAKAADTYRLTCVSRQKQVVYTNEEEFLYASLSINGKELSTGDAGRIKIKWTSSNNKVVKVSETYRSGAYPYKNMSKPYYFAEIIGVKKGTAIVTASYKGASCKFKVTVKGATIQPAERSIDGSRGGGAYFKTICVPAGSSLGLSVHGDSWADENGVKVSFTGADESIAKVESEEGSAYCTVTGIKEGKTTLTAKSSKGKIKTAIVVLPKLNLQIKNIKYVKKNGKISGYSFDAVNKSAKPVSIEEVYTVYSSPDDYFPYDCSFNNKKVTVKSGKTQKVTVTMNDEDGIKMIKNEKLKGGSMSIEVVVKYEGHLFLLKYGRDMACFSISMI